jgi:hypothetical protein
MVHFLSRAERGRRGVLQNEMLVLIGTGTRSCLSLLVSEQNFVTALCSTIHRTSYRIVAMFCESIFMISFDGPVETQARPCNRSGLAHHATSDLSSR